MSDLAKTIEKPMEKQRKSMEIQCSSRAPPPPNPYESRSVWRMPELRQLPAAKWTGAQMHPLLSPFPPSPRETLYDVLLSTGSRGEHRSESPRAAQRLVPGNPYEKL